MSVQEISLSIINPADDIRSVNMILGGLEVIRFEFTVKWTGVTGPLGFIPIYA